MASRRLSSSLLRPFLRRSPPQFQAPASSRSFSVPKFTSQITKFPQTEAFSRFESGYGLASVWRSSELGSCKHFGGSPNLLLAGICQQRLLLLILLLKTILDKEAVEEVRGQREIPDIKPGYIVQLKVEVPENKRRISIIKGIVIARRNAGLNTTFRIRRQVAGVGIESLFPLYSPNIKEIKVLDKKKVRRAKLYYLRDRMNALKN
ncbi:hypothetical protein ACSQ67_011742 [Phaseolus vulgaris]